MAPMMAMPAEMIAKTIGAAEGKEMESVGYRRRSRIIRRHAGAAQSQRRNCCAGLAGVLEVAKENAAAAGVADRYRTLPGSAFDVDYGAGYDVMLLTNFLHHFDVPTNEKLLRKVYAALAPGGQAVALEFVPNEDRISPPIAAKFSMIMLANTVRRTMPYTYFPISENVSERGIQSRACCIRRRLGSRLLWRRRGVRNT